MWFGSGRSGHCHSMILLVTACGDAELPTPPPTHTAYLPLRRAYPTTQT